MLSTSWLKVDNYSTIKHYTMICDVQFDFVLGKWSVRGRLYLMHTIVILYGEVQLPKESFEALCAFFPLGAMFFLLAIWREREKFSLYSVYSLPLLSTFVTKS